MRSVYEEVAAAYEAQAAANSKLAEVFHALAKGEGAGEGTTRKKTVNKAAAPAQNQQEATQPKIEDTDSPKAKPSATFEDVRRVLAQKSVEGHTEEVRALIQRYGAKKLSDLGSECYEPLLLEAEGIGNGK